MKRERSSGGKVFWKSEDGRIVIRRHCHGVFSLEYDGNTVIEGSFKAVENYAWAEFIEWDQWKTWPEEEEK